MFDNIPLEMRQLPSWVVWRFEDTGRPKPTKVPYNVRTQGKASSTDPNTWATFDECVSAFNQFQGNGIDGIGFVLSENDPYCIIDGDDPTSIENPMQRDAMTKVLMRIVNEFDSYTEISPSGKGFHIITKGKTIAGRRRGKVEVYSSGRFMTMTGNVWINKPIEERQVTIDLLLGEMGKSGQESTFAATLDAAETISDQELYSRAVNASNGQRFYDLFHTPALKHIEDGQGLDSSGLDQALMNIIGFYTENREQCRRMFMYSERGKRDKYAEATKDRLIYLLDRMTTKAFDQKLPPVDIQGIHRNLEEAVSKLTNSVPLPVANHSNPLEEPLIMNIKPPPGLVGEIAQFIYSAVPMPVAQISIAASIGLLSGIAGKAYNISGTGLNQYVLLLAATGVGKEGIHKGIDKVMRAVTKTNQSAGNFIGPAEIASPQALYKYLDIKDNRSFVSIIGEFGLALKQMADPKAPAHLVGLRRFLLELFNKSGKGDTVKKTIAADKDKNTNEILAPAVTLLGESTPERFYDYLDEGMVAEGLLPRFTIIEYDGEAPAFNNAHGDAVMPEELTRRLSALCANAYHLNSVDQVIDVQIDSEAQVYLDEFLAKSKRVQIGARELVRQIWSRAHIKALKLAGLVAVGCDPFHPVVNLEQAQWACSIIEMDCRKILKRFDSGEVGSGSEENKQRAAIEGAFRKFYSMDWEAAHKAQVSEAAFKARIVSRSFITNRVKLLSVFKNAKPSQSFALDRMLMNMCDDGDIMLATAHDYPDIVKRNGKFYVVLNTSILNEK